MDYKKAADSFESGFLK